MSAPDYSVLQRILDDAFKQASAEKGKERHEDGRDWPDQPIFTIPKLTGDTGFQSGQAIKKLGESCGMARRGQFDAAYREALGAIVYAASLAHSFEIMRAAQPQPQLQPFTVTFNREKLQTAINEMLAEKIARTKFVPSTDGAFDLAKVKLSDYEKSRKSD